MEWNENGNGISKLSVEESDELITLLSWGWIVPFSVFRMVGVSMIIQTSWSGMMASIDRGYDRWGAGELGSWGGGCTA